MYEGNKKNAFQKALDHIETVKLQKRKASNTSGPPAKKSKQQ